MSYAAWLRVGVLSTSMVLDWGGLSTLNNTAPVLLHGQLLKWFVHHKMHAWAFISSLPPACLSACMNAQSTNICRELFNDCCQELLHSPDVDTPLKTALTKCGIQGWSFWRSPAKCVVQHPSPWTHTGIYYHEQVYSWITTLMIEVDSLCWLKTLTHTLHPVIFIHTRR